VQSIRKFRWHFYFTIPAIQLEVDLHAFAGSDARRLSVAHWEYDHAFAAYTSSGALIRIAIDRYFQRRAFIPAYFI
jgi:hypothetical protein